MGIPVVIAENGFGLPVVDATEDGLGLAVTVAENGYGTPVVIVENGYGMPAVFDPPIAVPTEPPANLSAPSIADTTPTVGETISCWRGLWSNPPNSFSYQWFRTEAAEEDPFVFVDSASAGSLSGGGTFSTGAIDTTGATLLIAGLSDYNGAAAPAVSDSKGNIWVPLTSHTAGAAPRSRMFYSIATAVGASHTMTVTGSGFYGSATFAAFGGPVTPAFDLEAGATGSSGIASAGAGITPSVADAVVIVNVACDPPTAPVSISSSFVMLDIIAPTANHFGHALAYLIQTAAVAADPDWTLSGSGFWAASIASFKYEE